MDYRRLDLHRRRCFLSMSPILDFGFHFRWDFIHYAAFSPLLFHPLAHITTTNTVPFVLRPFTLCWDVFALFYLPLSVLLLPI